MSETKLLPCPFCGDEDTFIVNSERTATYVECGECQAMGPIGYGDEEAISKWNARHERTCRIHGTDHEYEDSVRCSSCGATFKRPWSPFRFCPSCGARVAEP